MSLTYCFKISKRRMRNKILDIDSFPLIIIAPHPAEYGPLPYADEKRARARVRFG